ncbi:hypothetical protein ACOI9X_02695 [Pseudomonas sp. P2757]|uniref:hypothetical protein n=1 Tax=unclassified Pseudomonas TaxID=196821 RepID=UPI003B5BB2D7
MKKTDKPEKKSRAKLPKQPATAGSLEPIADSVTSSGESAVLDLENIPRLPVTITASKGGYSATLRAECWWNYAATDFTFRTLWYKATDNGRDAGNVRVLIEAGGSDKWEEELIDNAVQDGQEKTLVMARTIAARGTTARCVFGYEYDTPGTDTDMHDQVIVSLPALASPVMNPIKNVNRSSFPVSGTSGIPGAELRVYRNFDYITALATIHPGGSWTATVNLPDNLNDMTIASHQKIANRQSAPSNGFRVYRAAITSPTENEVVPEKELTFRGIAAPNTVMRAVHSNVGTAWSNPVNTGQGTTWAAAMLPKLGLGSGQIPVIVEIDGDSRHYTDPVTFWLLGYPRITNTVFDVTRGFTLTGNNRLSGATVTAYIGSSETVVGTTPAATTAAFSILTDTKPGLIVITTQANHSGKSSGRSDGVTFRVAPLQPTLKYKVENDIGTLEGTGYGTAKLQVKGDYSFFHEVTVAGTDTWTLSIPVTRMPGNYRVSAIQYVDPGSIWSAPSSEIVIQVPVPVPTAVVSSQNNHQLIFSGRGHNWDGKQVQIVFYNNGIDMQPGVPAVTVPPSLNWSVYSSAYFAPGTYDKLTAKMLVNTLFSRAVPVPQVIIPSPQPVLDPHPAPTGQRPTISGRVWPGSVVTTTVPGGSIPPVTAVGAEFSQVSTTDWPPGTHTVTVTAAFGGQISPVATQTLTVRTPQPQITTAPGPVPLIATLVCSGWQGCLIEVFTTVGNVRLGSGTVQPNGTVEIILSKQTPGEQTLYALQYEKDKPGNVSVQSPHVAMRFGVPTATITMPPEGGTTTRTSDFSGTTTALGDTVELWRGNTLLAKDIRITNGTWMAKGIKLDVGLDQEIDVLVRQDAHQSEAITRTVKVVPEKLIFDAPQNGQNISAQMWFSGSGAFPGDNVILRRVGANHDFAPVLVDAFGHWATKLQHNMVATDKITAFARAGAGLDSALADQITPKLLYAIAPHFTEPQAGDRTGTKPIFKGLARPRSTVTISQWYNGASELAKIVADDEGRWEVQSTVALLAGGNWVQARDALGGQHSEWRRSEYFEVRAAVTGFTPPIVDFPKQGEEVGLKTAFSGRGLAGADVHVYKKSVGVPLATFTVDRDGRWSGSLAQSLQIEDFTFSVRQERDTVISGWLVPDRTVKIVQLPAGFAKPVISLPVDDPNQTLEPNPWAAGKGVPGATLRLYADGVPGVAIAETRVHADGNWATRFKNVLAAGAHKITAQQERDGKLSAWSGIVIDFNVGTLPLPPIITNIHPEDDVPHNLVLEGKAMPYARVNLYKHGVNSVIGTGIADKDGVWTIKLYNLPLDEFIFNGKTVHGTVESGWMALFTVYIHNLG